MNFVQGIDLCSLQGQVDWQQVADAGFKFAYVKSSQYSSTYDHRFDQYVAGAEKVGIAAGAYHFAYCGSDPVAQAKFFFKASSGVGGHIGDLPPVLDLEYAKNIPPQDVVSWAERFMETAEDLWYPENRLDEALKLPFRRPVLYTYPWFARSLQPHLAKSKLTRNRLWVANYKSDASGKLIPWEPKWGEEPATVDGWDWSIWQYSGNNGKRVPGVSVDCDRNVLSPSVTLDMLCGRWEVPPEQPIVRPKVPFGGSTDG